MGYGNPFVVGWYPTNFPSYYYGIKIKIDEKKNYFE
jgi:hypothetical protein